MPPLWLLMLLQKFGPILGERLLDVLVKKIESIEFKKSPQEVKLEGKETWVSNAKLPKVFIKSGAKINGGHFYPEIVAIVTAARETAPDTSDGAIWITSGAEKAPNRLVHSKHYENAALDFRISNLVEGQHAVDMWVMRLIEKLGPEYDVVKKSNHIHVEYDPKAVQEAR